MNMTHNYWGGTAANPADVTVAPLIAYDNPLGSAPFMGIIGVGATSLDASATAGVVITDAAGLTAQQVLGAFLLSGNPVSVALPSTVTSAVTAKSYYDVFGVGAAVSAILQFNGSATKPIASTDELFAWDPINGVWILVCYGW